MKQKTRKINKGRDHRIINKMILKLAKKNGLSVSYVGIGKTPFSMEADDVSKKFKDAEESERVRIQGGSKNGK